MNSYYWEADYRITNAFLTRKTSLLVPASAFMVPSNNCLFYCLSHLWDHKLREDKDYVSTAQGYIPSVKEGREGGKTGGSEGDKWHQVKKNKLVVNKLNEATVSLSVLIGLKTKSMSTYYTQ